MERVLPFHAHKEESFSERLSRRVPLEIVPIRPERTHDLAIISSLFYSETPSDIERYVQIIIDEFSGSDISVQVFFTDNTEENNFFEQLQETRRRLDSVGIDFQPSHVSRPGKVNGLNEALSNVTSEYVLSVDLNKFPAKGTLRSLYERIRNSNIDILSARVASTQNGNPLQWYVHGAAYIGRRWCFPGFPQILSDDQYSALLTLAQNGTIAIAKDLTVRDEKNNHLNFIDRRKRKARQYAGVVQLQYLKIIKGNSCLHLDKRNMCLWKKIASIEGISTIIDYIKQLPIEDRIKLPIHALISVLTLLKMDPLQVRENKAYLKKLYDNPKLCSWTT